MTPAEVIAMRDKLNEMIYGAFKDGSFRMHTDSRELADWLIESGWVTSEPKENVLDCKREEESK